MQGEPNNSNASSDEAHDWKTPMVIDYMDKDSPRLMYHSAEFRTNNPAWHRDKVVVVDIEHWASYDADVTQMRDQLEQELQTPFEHAIEKNRQSLLR